MSQQKELCSVKERIEHDMLGEVRLNADLLYGVHTYRALENFPLSKRRVNSALIHAYGAVKLACFQVNRELGYFPDPIVAEAIEKACLEMIEGLLDGWIRVDALQGGAGTSTNMNVNEVLANRALQLLGREPGDYKVIDPLADINRHQSTNDTYPSALHLAAIRCLRELEAGLIGLLEACQKKEKEFAHVTKVARTQLQDAVLSTAGRQFGAWAEALSRDRWRVYKCEERLRVINLGGTAIGTGLGAPRDYIFRVVGALKEISGIGLARAENLLEATQNHDALVEVSGIMSASAANILKIAGDLRLLSSGPDTGFGELRLPPRQAGSSIMPGKVNPVIPEAATQAALTVIANHQAISMACGMGNMELNAFLPLVADMLLGAIELLSGATRILHHHCLAEIQVDEELCRRHVDGATATLTSLVAEIGYAKTEELAEARIESGKTVRELVIEQGLLTSEQFAELSSPENVTKLGFTGGKNGGRDAEDA